MSKRPLPPDRPAPDLTRERALWQAGIPFVAGIDEAGRGALAGPVIAAAVIVPAGADFAGVWRAVRDSKLLRAGVRTTLAAEIRQCAAAWAVGAGSAEEIDRLGVAVATRLAMRRAVEGLACAPGHLLVDWVKLPQINLPQTCWAKADQQSVSVAAASILAKVHRDDLMIELDAVYPAYGFARHKGYGAPLPSGGAGGERAMPSASALVCAAGAATHAVR